LIIDHCHFSEELSFSQFCQSLTVFVDLYATVYDEKKGETAFALLQDFLAGFERDFSARLCYRLQLLIVEAGK
jgi:hypothetical protein